ncbi:uncharacterized protein LOC143146074 isoform X2 [Ptiloglossa arizonensis]|uniref:uncharacterized protein LOC143146074 isoform X2 n=1 Tax=Ptiloglossa arizonensis TaxID=3350558 RepID=UPI003F9F99D7
MFNLLHLKNILINMSLINKVKCFYRPLPKNLYLSVFCKSYHTSVNHACKIRSTRKSNEEIKLHTLNPDINVQNNVLLFKHIDITKFFVMKFFIFGWLFCCTVLFYYCYDPKYKTHLLENISWKDYIKQCGLNLIICLYLSLTGPLLVLTFHLAYKRCVKYIILHKGGEEISIITYHLFKNERILKLPLNTVSSICSRSEKKVYIPIKIKGHSFYFLIDGLGKFVNENLFDNTIGTKKF